MNHLCTRRVLLAALVAARRDGRWSPRVARPRTTGIQRRRRRRSRSPASRQAPIRTRRCKTGLEHRLDPEAARQPVRGVRALRHRRGDEGARRHEQDHRARRTPSRVVADARSSTPPSQQKADAIIIAGNDPDAVAPALKQAAQRGVEGRRHGLRRRAGRAQRVRQPGHDPARRREPGRVDRQADRLQGRDRDPLRDRQRDEPERLDRRDEGDAQAGQVQGHEARQGRLRRRRRPEVLPGDAGPDPGVSEPQGRHLPHDGRRSRRPRATCRARRRRARSS